ncbi:CRAL/TRIO domain [Nesidiocoris tenuis]|uniref:CRAL/TRIO domain n=1 Tax=Nesidiocoris tenuis TaxID=355587 RepID=A0ABN7ARD3_9HEMI|nr:CRAL/TRIO domain [Nesidiocoris tenuis]
MDEVQLKRPSPWKVKASEEFEKRAELKKEDLQTIREWMQSQSHLPQNVEDEMLLHFLQACYFDVNHTKNTIEFFYSYRTSMTEFFADWDPLSKETQEIVNNVLIAAPLPGNDEEGNKIIVCKLNDPNPAIFNYPICVKWLMITAQVAQWDMGIQDGYVIVYDAAGFSMSHLFKCTLGTIKNYINWGKNASPIRVLRLVFVNTSSVVKKTIALAKPFLSKELLGMMKFYTDTETYFSTLAKDTVPEDYGGTAAPILTLHRNHMKKIMEYQHDLIGEENMKSDETKRAGKSKKEVKQVEKSFKTLEID